MPEKNAVDVLSGATVSPGGSFFFRNDSHDLTIGTALNTTAVDAPGGTVILETTTSGNLVLQGSIGRNNAMVGSVALGSAGTITTPANAFFPNGGPPAVVFTDQLEILSANRVSLGAPQQTDPQGNMTNPRGAVGTIAGQVLNGGESFVFRSVSNLTVGSVDVVDTFGNRLLNPVTGVSLAGSLAGVTTSNANIALRTDSPSLTLAANVTAGTASVGLEFGWANLPKWRRCNNGWRIGDFDGRSSFARWS